MQNNHYRKLTPVKDADLSTYKEALDFAFSNEDILNVAISGPYGSGKSSVLESYKQLQQDEAGSKTFLHISFAHFKGKEQTLDANAEYAIEEKILNQLVQKVPEEATKQSSFRAKTKINAYRLLFYTAVLMLALISFGLLVGTKTLLPVLFPKKVQLAARIIGALFCICLSVLIYRILYLQGVKGIIKRVKFHDNEIELEKKSSDSFFDEHLDEVVFLFMNAGVDAVVFEDLDRFDSVVVFEKLREINALVNERLQKERSKDCRKYLRFFYLLKDEMFDNKDRTKFFDFIIPVVPVISGSNSFSKLKEHLDSLEIEGEFDRHIQPI